MSPDHRQPHPRLLEAEQQLADPSTARDVRRAAESHATMGPAVPGELPGTHGPQGRVAGILEIREIAE